MLTTHLASVQCTVQAVVHPENRAVVRFVQLCGQNGPVSRAYAPARAHVRACMPAQARKRVHSLHRLHKPSCHAAFGLCTQQHAQLMCTARARDFFHPLFEKKER